MEIDPETISLTELIQLQNRLSETLKRRFERPRALAFTDVVGSTPYFARFGDEAGRRLQQRHLDTLREVLPIGDGYIVDTAGDGAFTCFPYVEGAVAAMGELQRRILTSNVPFERPHRLSVRVGIHYGPVLTDGHQVAGDSVNLCARVASSAGGGEIRITRGAFHELPNHLRVRCEDPQLVELKGVPNPVEVLRFEWLDRTVFPEVLIIEDTGARLVLPSMDLIRVGRVREVNGVHANDVVLSHPDPEVARRISRWHFELHRQPDGFRLRSLSDQSTVVDGVFVPKGESVPVTPSSMVVVSGVLTLRFGSSAAQRAPAERLTTLGGTGPPRDRHGVSRLAPAPIVPSVEPRTGVAATAPPPPEEEDPR